VFSELDEVRFQDRFLSWVRAVSAISQGQVVAVDGKTLWRSHDRALGKGTIVMVSAWARGNCMVLSQTKADEKSAEVTAIPELLQVLDLSGCIISIDALGCHKDIAAEIVDQEADYVPALKQNQANLYDDVQLLFDDFEGSDFSAYAYDYERSVDKGHGRIEIRHRSTTSDPEILRYLRGATEWPNLASIVQVQAERQVAGNAATETRYYLSSLVGDAAQNLAT